MREFNIKGYPIKFHVEDSYTTFIYLKHHEFEIPIADVTIIDPTDITQQKEYWVTHYRVNFVENAIKWWKQLPITISQLPYKVTNFEEVVKIIIATQGASIEEMIKTGEEAFRLKKQEENLSRNIFPTEKIEKRIKELHNKIK